MITGTGRLFSLTTGRDDLTQNIFFPGLFSDFKATISNSPVEAEAWIDGEMQTVASSPGPEKVELEIAFQYLDFNTLQYTAQEKAQISNNVDIPIWRQTRIDNGEITDGDLATLTPEQAKKVYLYINERGSWGDAGELVPIDGASAPGPGEFKVDTTNSKLLVDNTLNGASMTYLVPQTFTTRSVGYEAIAAKWGKQEFWALAYSTEFGEGEVYVHFPDVTVKQRAIFAPVKGVHTWTMKFNCNVPRGGRRPFRYHKIVA